MSGLVNLWTDDMTEVFTLFMASSQPQKIILSSVGTSFTHFLKLTVSLNTADCQARLQNK